MSKEKKGSSVQGGKLFTMSKFTRTDVTAVKLHEDCILTGIGSWINVFDRKSAKLMQKIHALNGQKVYGIIPKNNNILVFGGKQFTVVRREDKYSFVKLFEAIVCSDWLHSGTWIDDGHVALLTAHNVVQKWSIFNKSLVTQHTSKDNSILYSGLLLPLQDDILVFCGTVFSEVLIHRCGNDTILHRLRGHKGVIFSVSCCLQKSVIVTTSDDRSVRIWQLSSTANFLPDSTEYWDSVNITCVHELYGHLARVMRNCIRDDFVISIGEDSNICFWSYDGNLLRKVTAHQNACIWSLDADDSSLVTGGGDSSIILHPLSIVTNYKLNEVLDIGIVNPKKVIFTARRNIVAMNENNDLVYYDTTAKTVTMFNLKHESTYKLLSISSCKQIIAIVDMFGKLDIFIENCKGPPGIKKIIDEKLQIGKILFMQWTGNRHLVFSSENGDITVLASRDDTTETYANFVLPPCKERWLTSAAIINSNNMVVVGDRCGSIHVYVVGQKNPLKSFKKVHGRYGPTSITFHKNELLTTGRDGTVRHFKIDNWDVKLMCSKNLDFQWVEKFVDKDEHYICGFHERIFVAYDIKNNNKLLEVPCGGGHRSWDIIRYIDKVDDTYEEIIKFMYLKNSNLNVDTFQLSNIVSRHIVNGTHSKEINCLKTYVCEEDASTAFLVSGGEDTSLRISKINCDGFQDEAIFNQLSSIRTVKLVLLSSNKVLVISAGGRAQICIKLVQFDKDDKQIKVRTEELCDYLIKGTDKERKGNQTWRNCTVDIDPETRVMDVDVFESDDNNFVIVAGCSDAFLRVFNFKHGDSNTTLKPLQELHHHETCILKTHIFEFQNKKILISCTTRGIVTFWEIINTNKVEHLDCTPFKSFSIHESGINSIGCTVITDTSILLATGGDDNEVRLNVIELNGSETTVKHKWSSNTLHCSQVTGVAIIEDYVVSTSIDQRVTLLKWNILEGIKCEFVTQVFSDVADVQGLEVLKNDSESISVCVFGKGFEIITMPKPSKH